MMTVRAGSEKAGTEEEDDDDGATMNVEAGRRVSRSFHPQPPCVLWRGQEVRVGARETRVSRWRPREALRAIDKNTLKSLAVVFKGDVKEGGDETKPGPIKQIPA